VKHTREDQSGFEGGTDETVYMNFAVQDTGCGLTPEEKEHLFQRFSQVFPRTHVQYGGSGLGLYISRTLVEMQGGEIGVATENGVGSTFAFYILARRTVKPDISSTSSFPGPLALPSPSGSPQESRANSSLPATCFPTPSISSPAEAPLIEPIHVLIVEDNIINQTVLRKQLLAQKWIVYVANHGTEALEFIRTSRFWKGCETSGVELNVVLMDHEMPIVDGVTCVKLIRQMEESGDLVAHVPIIAVTANARTEQVKILEVAGVVGVVS
jgi:CheY-like chemotaxis protein